MIDKQRADEFDRALESAEKQVDEFTDALERAEAAEKAVAEANERMRAGLDKTKSKLEETAQVAEELASVSDTLLVSGAALTGAIFASAKSYVDSMRDAGDEGEEIAQRWIAAEDRLKASLIDVGRVSAEAILPTLEKAADLAEKAAAFVEENPDLVGAALKIGAITATVGAVGSLVARGVRFYADFKFLAAMTQYSLATAAFGKHVQLYAASGRFGLGGLRGAKYNFGGAAAGAAGAGGVSSTIGGLLTAAAPFIAAAGGILAGFKGYDMIAEANNWRSSSEIIRMQLATNVGAFTIAARDLGLITEETASTFWQSTKEYLGLAEVATQQIEEQSQTAKNASSEIQSINQSTEQQSKMTAQQVAQYNETIANGLTSSYSEAVQAQQQTAAAAREIRQTVYHEEVSDLTIAMTHERDLKHKFYEESARNIVEVNMYTQKGIIESTRSFFSQIEQIFSRTTLMQPPPGLASGGYATSGLYELGEAGREFVMSNSTTRAAERAIGGQLTQSAILSLLGNRKTLTYNDNRRIDSRLSPSDRRVIADDTLSILAGAIG
jgi:methyl-accepting chemotaxis protein